MLNKIKYIKLPIIAIFLLLFLYGGIGFMKEEKQVRDNQNDLQSKISFLQNEATQNQNSNNNKIADLQNKIKKSATEQKKTITTSEIQYIDKPIVQTVTNVVTQPVSQATLTIEGVGSYKVDLMKDDNAFSVLQRAASQNNFKIQYQTYSGLGVFVTSIGGITPQGNQFWAFYYNGKLSEVGSSSQKISNDDSIYWRLESF